MSITDDTGRRSQRDDDTKTSRPRRHRLRRRLAPLIGVAAVAVAVPAAPAHADPPTKLPLSAPEADLRYQPAMDYDRDGCYPTPAIGPDGTLNPGLNLTGDVNGHCRDLDDLNNTNMYSRSKCNHGWCAYMYGLYFEKDQVSNGASAGHRHDWEHIVVWVDQGTGRVGWVATSAHGNYELTAYPNENQLSGDTHPKVVYHKGGGSTHSMRMAKFDGGDEPPENHAGMWQWPALVGWDNFPSGIRDKLVNASFGEATLALKDGQFVDQLRKAKPDIPFDPAG